MHISKIEWVLNPDNKTLGWIWNPITGCLNHVDGLCKGGGFPCYAHRLANTRLKDRYLANGLVACDYEGGENDSDSELKAAFADPFYPRFWPERLDDIKREPLPWFHQGKDLRKGIFVCDMGELFGDWVPQKWQEMIFHVIKINPQHRFYLLTKQPQNLPKFSPFPDNCWVGVTVTNDSMMPAVVKAFDAIWAKVRFISFEPLLGRLSKERLKQIRNCVCDWAILGSQTNPYKPPTIEAIQEIVEAADKASIPIFLKDNIFEDHSLCELEFRQEMPGE